MDKILMILRQLVFWMLERDCAVTDPLDRMSPRELADLPPVHPRRNDCLC